MKAGDLMYLSTENLNLPKDQALSQTMHSHCTRMSHPFAHRPFPRTQTFLRLVIECTATDHVIFS